MIHGQMGWDGMECRRGWQSNANEAVAPSHMEELVQKEQVAGRSGWVCHSRPTRAPGSALAQEKAVRELFCVEASRQPNPISEPRAAWGVSGRRDKEQTIIAHGRLRSWWAAMTWPGRMRARPKACAVPDTVYQKCCTKSAVPKALSSLRPRVCHDEQVLQMASGAMARLVWGVAHRERACLASHRGRRVETTAGVLQGIAAAAAQARNKRADGPAAHPRRFRGSHARRVIGALSGSRPASYLLLPKLQLPTASATAQHCPRLGQGWPCPARELVPMPKTKSTCTSHGPKTRAAPPSRSLPLLTKKAPSRHSRVHSACPFF
jgi:hypothetical protein